MWRRSKPSPRSGLRAQVSLARPPQILYERHWFRKFTYGQFDASNPKVSGKRGGYKRGASEHTRLEDAIGLDREAALKFAS
jgi:hypothetical protein